ncbi:MAG: UvrD-helicase domain-containing protein [bacterium]|nr:UvrD-helicase domain-containing protein [bacterium]
MSTLEQNIHLLIRASAGTGKTWQLSNRLIRLLVDGESPERCLATTFTRKAAGEIRDRVYRRLADAALSDVAAERLGNEIFRRGLSKEDFQRLLARVVDTQHRFSVVTIDGLFASIARSFSLELELPPGWSLLDPLLEQRLHSEVLSSLFGQLDEGTRADFLRLLFPGEASAMVVRKLLGDISRFCEVFSASRPSAWNWYKAPVNLLSESSSTECYEALLRIPLPRNKNGSENALWRKAFDQLQAIVKEANWEAFCRHGFVRAMLEGKDSYSKQEINEEVLAVLLPFVEQARAVLLSRLVTSTQSMRDFLSAYCLMLDRALRRNAAVRFSDVGRLISSKDIMQSMPEVYYRLDAQARHVLFDEFQDTSSEQWRVLRPLVEETVAHADKSHSFFCVGDVKQAIYGWRGGESRLFDEVCDLWPYLHSVDMQRSYRSSQAVISAVNEIFTRLPQVDTIAESDDVFARVVAEWTKGFITHETAKTSTGYVELRQVQCGDDKEAGLVAETVSLVRSLLRENPDLSVAILLRRNKLINRFLYAFQNPPAGGESIEASGEGGASLMDSRLVQGYVALLRAAEHPDDSLARQYFLSSPLSELYLGSACTEVSLFMEQIRDQICEQGIGRATSVILRRLLSRDDSGSPLYSAHDRQRAASLIEKAYIYERQPAGERLDDFVRYIESTTVESAKPASVRVMTIHKSKGLEFDAVILPELSQPLTQGAGDALIAVADSVSGFYDRVVVRPTKEQQLLDPRLKNVVEEARKKQLSDSLSVLYVGVTRAAEALYMLIPDTGLRGTTYAGILREILASGAVENEEGQGSAVIYASGDPRWYDTFSAEVRVLVEEPPVLPFVFSAPVVLRQRGLQHKAASDASSEKVSLARIVSGEARQETEFGSVVHLLLSRLSWVEDETEWQSTVIQELSLMEQSSEWRLAIKNSSGEIRNLLFSAWKSPELRRCFLASGFAGEQPQLFRELPWVLRQGNSLVRGVIDRLVVYRVGGHLKAEVFDFKVSGETDQGVLFQRYQSQLSAYRNAVSQMWKIAEDDVATRLVVLNAAEGER